MTRFGKDLLATALTAVVALTFAATHEGWNVPLVGDSHRWAAVVVLVVGAITCGLGDGQPLAKYRPASVLGAIALGLALLAIATGSLTVLSLLVAVIVVLWAMATVGHVRQAPRHPVAT
jgi:hypothetical protein